MRFKKNQVEVQALINSDNKVNGIIWLYITKLGFKIHATDIEVKKLDGFILMTFNMILNSF